MDVAGRVLCAVDRAVSRHQLAEDRAAEPQTHVLRLQAELHRRRSPAGVFTLRICAIKASMGFSEDNQRDLECDKPGEERAQ